MRVTAVTGGLVALQEETVIRETQETYSAAAALRFRSASELRSALQAVGFAVEQISGGWQRQAVGQGNGELIVVARRCA